MTYRCRWADCALITDDDDEASAHATEWGHWRCGVCGQSQTDDDPRGCCESCLARTRADLAAIVALHAELPAHLGHTSGTAYDRQRGGGDEHTLPGGTVLALLGPGNNGGAARRLTRSDIARGEDGREHRVDNRPEDTPSVAFTLYGWATDWSAIRGDGAYDEGMTA